MTDRPSDKKIIDDQTQLIACQTCLKEVPKSEAKISEAQDYVIHFCGIDCYEQWQKQQNNNG